MPGTEQHDDEDPFHKDEDSGDVSQVRGGRTVRRLVRGAAAAAVMVITGVVSELAAAELLDLIG